MKNTVKFLSIFILFSCSPSEEELKIAVDEIYNQVKTIPSSKPCENLDGYKNLEAYESRYKTNFYSELTSQKIKLYEEECSKKIIADEKEKERKAELRKLKKSLNYGKLTKDEIIDLMMENKDKFNHIEMYEKPAKKTHIIHHFHVF